MSGYLYAIGAAVTWGLVYCVDQKVLRGASPFAFLFINYLISAILLLPVIFFDRHSLVSLSSFSGKTWLLVFASLLLAILANFLIFSSIKILGASTASIFEIAYPFFVVIFSYFIFRSTPSIYFLLGALLIFSGASIIVMFS